MRVFWVIMHDVISVSAIKQPQIETTVLNLSVL